MKSIKWGKPNSLYDRPNTPEALGARMAVANATIAACNASALKSAKQTIALSIISIGCSVIALIASGAVLGHRAGWW